MDLFPDGQHVWLRSSGRGEMYLHADEDGVGVRVSSKRASLLSAWKVHHVVSPGGQTYTLLYSAANGRYLTGSLRPAPHGHKGRLVIQGPYNDNNFNYVAWRPERVGDGDGGNEVRLHHYSGRVLRANGEFFFWNKGVTADVNSIHNRNTPMSHWVVRAIPPRPFPPQLPAPVPDRGSFCICNKMHIGSVVPGEPGRVIQYARAADDGTLAPNAWNELRFNGRSVANLRAAVAGALEEANIQGIMLRARQGTLARLIPLAMDLSRYEEEIYIVVLNEGSPAAAALQHPDVDAQ